MIQSPRVVRTYRQLQNYYQARGLTNEAAAFGHLIEKKFPKKDGPDHHAPDNPQ